jgi:hypothetical protein
MSFNTVELDFVDLPNYIKIKLLIGDCGFYINEIEGMYLDVIVNWQYIKSHLIHKTTKIYIMYKTCLKVKYRQ